VLGSGWGKVGVLLRIYLAGNVTIETPQLTIADWRAAGRQGRLAFAMLAGEHLRAVPRDELAGELWPHDAPPSQERALTAVISKVRAVLACAAITDLDIVSRFGAYQLRVPTGIWVDTRAAMEAIDRAEGAMRSALYREAWPLAQIACHITRRPFLIGDEGPWVTRMRREMQTVLLRAHECLAEIYIWNNEPATATRHATMAIELEPFRETAHQLLMRAHAAAGNRAEALRAYDRCRTLLAEELGVSPSPALDHLYETVLTSTGPV
jgi:DNA-binding SARP family transcriptional activator